MTLEVYKYKNDSNNCIGYETISPGEYKTLINVNSDLEEEVIMLHCLENNSRSIAYTIHPKTILYECHPPLLIYDRNTDIENRALRIEIGSEVMINVRERSIGSKKYTMARYRLAHR